MSLIKLISVHWGSTPVSLLIRHAVSIPCLKYAESVVSVACFSKSGYEVKRTSHVTCCCTCRRSSSGSSDINEHTAGVVTISNSCSSTNLWKHNIISTIVCSKLGKTWLLYTRQYVNIYYIYIIVAQDKA